MRLFILVITLFVVTNINAQTRTWTSQGLFMNPRAVNPDSAFIVPRSTSLFLPVNLGRDSLGAIFYYTTGNKFYGRFNTGVKAFVTDDGLINIYNTSGYLTANRTFTGRNNLYGLSMDSLAYLGQAIRSTTNDSLAQITAIPGATEVGSYTVSTNRTSKITTGIVPGGYRIQLYNTGTNTGIYIDSINNIGVGTVAPAYKLDVNGIIRSRSGITSSGTDAAAVQIDGATTGATNNYALLVNGTGTSKFITSLSVTGGIWTGASTNGSTNYSASNFGAVGGMVGGTSSTGGVLFGGAATVTGRVFFNGINTTVIGAGNTAANVIIGTNNLTAAAAGTHAVIANLAIVAPTINTSTATISSTASLYVDGAPSGGARNWAFLVNAGSTYLKGGFRTDDSLSVGGKIIMPIRTVTGTTTVSSTDHTLIINNTGAATINLPAASTSVNRILVVKKISTTLNNVIITANGAETIDGLNTLTLTLQYSTIMLQCDGVSWYVIAGLAGGTSL